MLHPQPPSQPFGASSAGAGVRAHRSTIGVTTSPWSTEGGSQGVNESPRPIHPQPTSIAQLVELTRAARAKAAEANNAPPPPTPTPETGENQAKSTPSTSAAARSRARKKRAALMSDEDEDLDLGPIPLPLMSALPLTINTVEPVATRTKDRRNASFIGQKKVGMGDTFEGATNRGVTFFTHRDGRNKEKTDGGDLAADDGADGESKSVSPIGSGKLRSRRLVDPGVAVASRPSLSSATENLRDADLKRTLDNQREDDRRENEKRHTKHDLRVQTISGPPANPAPSPPPLASPNTHKDPSAAIVQVHTLTQAELEQQVLDEWTSSDDDDVHIPEEFKTGTLLSRTTRRAFGLRSMREVMNLLSKPLAKREYPLEEYAQSGAFQSVSYWPSEGRFANLVLTTPASTHTNPHLVDPRAPVNSGERLIQEMIEPYLKQIAQPTPPERGTVAHARHQSLQGFVKHISLSMGEEEVAALNLLAKKEAASSPSNGGATTGASNHVTTSSISSIGSIVGDVTGAAVLPSPAAPPIDSSTTTSILSQDLQHAFAMLDPSIMNQTESEALALFLRNSAKLKKQQAIELFAAAQAAPFVKLRRDLEDRPDRGGDAFQRYLANDHPLLTDDQIDKLLAAKIDESVRKGFPRNRAELRGLSAKGAVSFGLPRTARVSTTSSATLEKELNQLVSRDGCVANTMQDMFHDDRLMRASHRVRNLVGLTRPYSAQSTQMRKAHKQVNDARIHTQAILRDTPPVGAYNPTNVSSINTFSMGGGGLVDFSSQPGRDVALIEPLGLGRPAHVLKGCNFENLKRPSTALPIRGPGPADTHVERWLDRSSLRDRSGSAGIGMQPGAAFSQADVGTATMSETGVSQLALSSTSNAAFSSIQMRGKDFKEPEPFIPLRMSKVYSSIGKGQAVSFSSAVSATRAPDGSLYGVLHPPPSSGAADVLQHAESSTIGRTAPQSLLRRGVAIGFSKMDRPGMTILDERQLKSQRDRRMEERRHQLDQQKQDLVARREVARHKKEARLERLRIEIAKRDAEYFAKNLDRRVGVEGAREKVIAFKERIRKEREAEANQTQTATNHANGDDAKEEDQAPPPSGVSRRGSLTRPSSLVPSTKNDLDTDSDASDAPQRFIAVPTKHELQSQRESRQQSRAERHRAVKERRQQLEATKHSQALSSINQRTLRLTQEKDEADMEVSMNLGHLSRGVAARVLTAKDAWRRLVYRRRRDRAACTLQRFFRRLVRASRHSRIRHAGAVLIDFFQYLSGRAKVKTLIVLFKVKVVRLQRWWRRHVPILRARRDTLERLWTKTLQVRWEELLKYRLYLTSIITDAATGGYTSAAGQRIAIPPEERQRFSNLIVVWKANEEDANATSNVHPPAPSPTAATSAINAIGLHVPSSVENIWERFVWPMFRHLNHSSVIGVDRSTTPKSPPTATYTRQRKPSKFHTPGTPASNTTPRTKHYSTPSATLNLINMGMTITINTEPTPTHPPQSPTAAGGVKEDAPPTPTHASSRRVPNLPPPPSAIGLTVNVGGPSPRKGPANAAGSATVSSPTAVGPAAAIGTTGSAAFSSDKAQLDFELYLGVMKPQPLKEGSGTGAGVGVGVGMSSVSSTVGIGLGLGVGVGVGVGVGIATGVGVTITANSENATSLLLQARRTALRNMYLRVRMAHRKLIYQMRTFENATKITTTTLPTKKQHRGRSGSIALESTINEEEVDDDSQFNKSNNVTLTMGGSTPSSLDAYTITGEFDTGRYSLAHGLSIHRSSRWLHLLSLTGMEELLMECMIPRCLQSAFHSGFILRTRHELVKVLRERISEPYLQLRHHHGWPWFQQEYGMPQQIPNGMTIIGINTAHAGEILAHVGSMSSINATAATATAVPPTGSRPASAFTRTRGVGASIDLAATPRSKARIIALQTTQPATPTNASTMAHHTRVGSNVSNASATKRKKKAKTKQTTNHPDTHTNKQQ